MKKVCVYFFTTLGVIFFVILSAGAYVWIMDPFHIRPLVDTLFHDSQESVTEAATQGKNTSSVVESNEEEIEDKNSVLSPAQEEALETIGIDPARIPSTITPEMENCFVEILGEARVAEIKNGSTPTAIEVFTSRQCYE